MSIELFNAEALKRLGAWSPATLAAQAASDPHPFVVEDLIFKNTVNISVGDSTIGKTPLLMSMAIAVASGKPWMGRRTNQGNVLFIDGESTLDSTNRMVTTLSTFAGLSEPPHNLVIFGWNFDYRDEPGDIFHTMQQLVRETQPTLVVVDPLRVFWPKAELESQEAMAMLRWQQKVGRDFQTAWITQHHRRKPDTKVPLNLIEEPRAWLLEASGTKALINQTHTRLGIDYEPTNQDQLIIGGLVRDLGPMKAPMRIERVYDADGDPLAYRPLQGISHLTEAEKAALEKLGKSSSYKDVKTALGAKSDSKVQMFIATLTNLQLLRAEGEAGTKKRRYIKLDAADAGLEAERAEEDARKKEWEAAFAKHMPWIHSTDDDTATVLPFAKPDRAEDAA